MTQETVQAEIVSEQRPKRPELFINIWRELDGWSVGDLHATPERCRAAAENDAAVDVIVRIPAEYETAIDWKKRAVAAAQYIKTIEAGAIDKSHTLAALSGAVPIANAILKDAGAA